MLDQTTYVDPVVSYRSPNGRARWCMIFLVLYGVVSVAGIASTLMEIDLLQQIDRGIFVSQADALANDERQALIGFLILGSFVLAAVSFLIWLYRVSKNLAPLGTENQDFSAGWAVGFWFIPIASLFVPYQVVKEIWKGSLPEPYSGIPTASAEMPISRLLGPWWATWLIGGWAGNFSAVLFFGDSTTVQELITSDYMSVLSSLVLLIALILVLVLVRQITKNQEKRHAERGRLELNSAS